MKKNQQSTNENHSSGKKVFSEAAEHVAEHAIGHAIAGPVGSLFAGLFHVGTLNENEEVNTLKKEDLDKLNQDDKQKIPSQHSFKPKQ